ncbi:acylphosphatase [Salinisphaera sp. T31B1]|uniref:acylphosphatase n=1 Tax=Salinisphaera sp. T31B1 TaxID=727963 RepID=UPI0033413F3F
MPETRHFTVTGRVQGVGFRAATRDRARSLGLAGWVRNRADGSVEGLARGDAQTLDALEAWLAQGPAMARVDTLVCEGIDDRPEKAVGQFEIR